MTYYLTGVFLMALFTYIPRFIPLTFYRKKIENKFIKSLLYYLPYAALASLTLPGILTSTPHLYESIFGGLVALYFSYKEKGLVFVAIASIIACYISYLVMTLI